MRCVEATVAMMNVFLVYHKDALIKKEKTNSFDVFMMVLVNYFHLIVKFLQIMENLSQ